MQSFWSVWLSSPTLTNRDIRALEYITFAATESNPVENLANLKIRGLPMGATRALLLAASQNRWLRERASRYTFVKKSVSRFMPGETLDDAIAAARELKEK